MFRKIVALAEPAHGCRFWHRWQEVQENYLNSHKKTIYFQCGRCGARKIEQIGIGGYQPVDWGWVTTLDTDTTPDPAC